METELTKNDIDPKVRKQIHKDIKQIDDTIRKMTVPKPNDPESVKKAYSAWMLKACGGDIRELFNKNRPIGEFDKYKSSISKVKIK